MYLRRKIPVKKMKSRVQQSDSSIVKNFSGLQKNSF